MSSAKQTLAALHKKFGEGIGGLDHEWEDVARLPTGVFPMDVALGGGLPCARTTVVYGGASSGKTSLLLKSIATFQKMRPKMVAAMVDVEGTTDRQFASRFGVDWSKLIHVVPGYGEHAVDMVFSLMASKDVGFVGVDSIAALTASGEKEVETEAEKDVMGRGGLLGRKLFVKANYRLNNIRAEEGREVVLFCINQPRYQIGMVMGNPERLPGGDYQGFHASLVIRLWGKALIDTKYHKTMPYVRETKGRVVKKKIPILSESFEYKLALLDHKGVKEGFCDDWGFLKGHLGAMGWLVKDKSKWLLGGEAYDRLEDVRVQIQQDRKLAKAIRDGIVEHLSKANTKV